MIMTLTTFKFFSLPRDKMIQCNTDYEAYSKTQLIISYHPDSDQLSGPHRTGSLLPGIALGPIIYNHLIHKIQILEKSLESRARKNSVNHAKHGIISNYKFVRITTVTL